MIEAEFKGRFADKKHDLMSTVPAYIADDQAGNPGTAPKQVSMDAALEDAVDALRRRRRRVCRRRAHWPARGQGSEVNVKVLTEWDNSRPGRGMIVGRGVGVLV